MAMFMAIEKFLALHLDGRNQEGGTDEVKKRLVEITVDPKTVTATKKLDPSAAQMTPKPTRPLVEATYKYEGKISMGGQEMAIKLSTSIQDKGGNWLVTDLMETPMGIAKDESTLDKATLQVLKRSVHQGPVVVEIQFADGRAKGTLSMNGQEKPIDAETGGLLFADGAGAQQSIAALPLAEGYTAVYRNFDIQKQKQKLLQLKVTGSEKVTVAAGTFDTYKVDISSAEGGPEKMTIWIAKDSRKAVKISALMPQMGGATMVAELVP